MSSRGLPSWYKYRAYGPVYEEIRLAEHAVRLGSIDTFDRRGDVIFLDTFEHGLGRWLTSASGSSGTPNLSTNYARSSGLSCCLHTPATEGYFSSISHYSPIPVFTKRGIEASFSLPTAETILEVSQYFYIGTTRTYFAVRYNQPNSTLEYFGSDNDWHVLASSVRPYPRDYCFNTLKLVVDLVTLQYVRCILNSTCYSMADLDARTTADLTAPYLQTLILLLNPAAEAKTLYVDDVILTQNEP